MEKVKLCVQCRYCGCETYPKCNAKKYVGSDTPVSGAYEMRSCWMHRQYNWLTARIIGVCGKEGRYWEPKG